MQQKQHWLPKIISSARKGSTIYFLSLLQDVSLRSSYWAHRWRLERPVITSSHHASITNFWKDFQIGLESRLLSPTFPTFICTNTHAPNAKSLLSTPVIHFPGLWLRGGAAGDGLLHPPTRCSIDLFVQCLPPPPPPLLPLSYSPSQCECVLKCLPALCNVERPTAYRWRGVWALGRQTWERPRTTLHC